MAGRGLKLGHHLVIALNRNGLHMLDLLRRCPAVKLIAVGNSVITLRSGKNTTVYPNMR